MLILFYAYLTVLSIEEEQAEISASFVLH